MSETESPARGRPPLVVWTTLLVLMAALLPMAISIYQLRTNSDALLEQVQVTHMVAASSAATRIDSQLDRFVGLAETLAEHAAVRARPQSPEAQNLLRATLVAEPRVASIAAFDPTGALIVRARRAGATDVPDGDAAMAARVAASADGDWLRFRADLPAGAALILTAERAPFTEAIQIREIGSSLRLVLVDRDRRAVSGDASVLDDLGSEQVDAAISGAVAAAAGIDRDAQGDVVWAFTPLENVDWTVLSHQDARTAEVARARIRRATAVGVGGAVLLTAIFAATIYGSLVRPLRRVIRTQRRLAGMEDGPVKGAEMDLLESSLDRLAERLRDREDLDEVFLGRYQVLDLAGTGSSSSVFRGWDPKLARPVALKTVRLDYGVDDSGRRKRQTDRLLGEAVSHARFVHPNIVTLYDLIDAGGSAFIAMEYVDGTSLDGYLKSYAPIESDQVIALGLAVAWALEVAHGDQLVHQDIKPGNILLGSDGSVKVADFGIAQLTPLAARSDESISGTPGYLPPESLEGRGYTPRSDLFALGVVLHEAATGRHPFRSHRRNETLLRTLEVDPRRVDEIRPGLPAALGVLISELLAKDPAARPASAQVVVERLEAIAGTEPAVWQPRPFPSHRSGSSSRPGPGATTRVTGSSSDPQPTESSSVRADDPR